jgi:S1-C subfamily serine protease
MSEGIFHLDVLKIPGLAADVLCAAMVRVVPRTILQLDIVQTPKEAYERARNEVLPDGSECWHRFFTPQDMTKVDDPAFSMAMVRHEFSQLVKSGACFPQAVPLQGGGTGFAISPAGHVLTNYHLVTAEVEVYGREHGSINSEVPCKGVRAQIATKDAWGSWCWHDSDAVWLVSNPPTSRAVCEDDKGVHHLREDTALLRVERPPSGFLTLSERPAVRGERVWMAGFPLRTARNPTVLQTCGYTDADGTLRISTGRIIETEGPDYFVSDIDGSMGNSGSPVFDESGEVIGLFSRASGDGPRNAVEYGHIFRIHVTCKLAITGLGLSGILPKSGRATSTADDDED